MRRRATCPSSPSRAAANGSGSGRRSAAWARRRARFLEGDERVFLDGSRHPGIYGTGVEDLFNGGFYFDQGPFTLPLHGAPAHRITPTGEDVTSAYRLFLADAIPFRSSLSARLEPGPTGNLPLRARTVAWYYTRPEPALVPVTGSTSRTARPAQSTHTRPCARSGLHRLHLALRGRPPRRAGGAGDELWIRGPGRAGAVRSAKASPQGAVRLRRRLDVLSPNPAADVYVNGVWVGAFPFQEANPFRRLREVDLDLPPQAVGTATELRFEVVPRLGAEGEAHTAMSYELRGWPAAP